MRAEARVHRPRVLPAQRAGAVARAVARTGACAMALGTVATLTACGAPAPGPITVTEQTSGTDVLLIAVSPVNERVVWVAGQRGTWLRTVDGGATWQAGQVPGADSLQFRDVQGVDERTAYVLSIGSGADSRIYKTTDAGASWTLQFTNAHPEAFFDCFGFWGAERGVAVSDAVDGRLVFITTDDAGASWTHVPTEGIPAALEGEGAFASSGTCLVTQPEGHAWVGTTKARVWHSADYGQTWSVVQSPLPVADTTGIASLSFRDARRGAAFGGFGATADDALVAVTDDAGATWTLRARPPVPSGVFAGAYVPNTRGPAMVVATRGGLAYSHDDGHTWTRVDSLTYWGLGAASPSAVWGVGTNGRITKLSGF